MGIRRSAERSYVLQYLVQDCEGVRAIFVCIRINCASALKREIIWLLTCGADWGPAAVLERRPAEVQLPPRAHDQGWRVPGKPPLPFLDLEP